MNAFLAIAFAIAAPTDGIDLKWKLKEGDTFYAKNQTVMNQTFTVRGQDIDQTMTNDTVVRFKVKSVKPGATVIDMTYLDNKATAKGLPGADAANGKLKGVTVTATLNGKLEIVKLQGYDKLLDALSDGNDATKNALKALLPEGTVRQMFSEMFGITPDGAVKAGDTWKRTDTMSLGGIGDITTASTFKLGEVKRDIATVNWTATGEFKIGDGDIPGAAVKLTKADLKIGKFTGSYTFDTTAGLLRTAKADVEISGTMTFSANGQDVTMSVKQKLTQSSTITETNPIKD